MMLLHSEPLADANKALDPNSYPKSSLVRSPSLSSPSPLCLVQGAWDVRGGSRVHTSSFQGAWQMGSGAWQMGSGAWQMGSVWVLGSILGLRFWGHLPVHLIPSGHLTMQTALLWGGTSPCRQPYCVGDSMHFLHTIHAGVVP